MKDGESLYSFHWGNWAPAVENCLPNSFRHQWNDYDLHGASVSVLLDKFNLNVLGIYVYVIMYMKKVF